MTDSFPPTLRSRVLQFGAGVDLPQYLADLTDSPRVHWLDQPYGKPARKDINLNEKKRNPIVSRFLALPKIVDLAKEHDVLFFHWESVLPFMLDLTLWKIMGKRVVLYYHGSEIRGRSFMHRFTLARLADEVYVSTPDLLQYVPEAQWSPHPFDVESVPRTEPDENHSSLRVLHAPSDPQKKGSSLIIDAIRCLQSKGESIEFRCLTNVPHERILKEIAWSDVVIDQVVEHIGVYGLTSCEAMAAGRPVICSIGPQYDQYFPDCPIIPIRRESVEEIEEGLMMLIRDRTLIRRLGRKGREYVERVHSPTEVLKRLFQE